VVLTLTRNFLNRIFFMVYGVMILALAGYTAMTWKRSGSKDSRMTLTRQTP
jgi:hypothetical protein